MARERDLAFMARRRPPALEELVAVDASQVGESGVSSSSFYPPVSVASVRRIRNDLPTPWRSPSQIFFVPPAAGADELRPPSQKAWPRWTVVTEQPRWAAISRKLSPRSMCEITGRRADGTKKT